MVGKRSYHFLHDWFPVLLYCLIIFFQSSYPSLARTPDLPYMDKLLHLAGYALLGMLFLRGFRHSRFNDHAGFIKLASIVLTGMYGATDEWHQHFVPYRSAELWDVFFDFAGAFLGVYLYQLFLEKYSIIRRI